MAVARRYVPGGMSEDNFMYRGIAMMRKSSFMKKYLTGFLILTTPFFLNACGSGGGGGGSSVPLVEQASIFGPRETSGVFDMYTNGTAITFSPVSGSDIVSISGSVSSSNGIFTCSITVTNMSATDMKGVSLRLGALDQSVTLLNADGYNFYNFGDIPTGKSSSRTDIAFNTGGSAVQVRVYITQWIKSAPSGLIEAGSGGQSQASSGISSGNSLLMDFKAGNALFSPSVSTISDGANTSLKLGSDGFPRVSYFQPSANSLKYAAYNGSAWIITLVEDGGTYGKTGQYSSLALTASNNPRISYYFNDDASNNPTRDLKYAFCNANCDQISNWGTVTVDSTGDVGGYTSIALNAAGNPRIVYYDFTNGDLKYAYCDANCQLAASWTITTVDSTGDVGKYASLALDSATGNPRISYYDSTNGDLKYASYTGAAWQIASVDTTNDVGGYTSLALDASGPPRISYYDFSPSTANGSSGGLNLKYASCNSSCENAANWTKVEVDNYDPYTNVNRDVGGYSSLVLDVSGNPVIIYYHGINYSNNAPELISGDLKYAYCLASCSSQANWKKITIDSDNDTGWFTSAAISNSNVLNITYFTSTNGNLNFMTINHPVSFTTPVDTYNNYDRGYYNSIKADTSNNPHIAYVDHRGANNQSSQIRYSYFNGSAWSTPAVVYSGATTTSNWEPQTSLALNSAGKPRILFTWDRIYLMYAWCDSGCNTATNWTSEIVKQLSAATSQAFISPSLVFDSSDAPVISYWQQDTTTAANSTIKYGYCTGSCTPTTKKWSWSASINPGDVAVDSTNGFVYAAMADPYSDVLKFDISGNSLGGWGSQCSFSPPFTPLSACDGKMTYPQSIAVDKTGNVYLADGYKRVSKFTGAGAFITKWGKNGGDGTQGSGDGEFWAGISVAVDQSVVDGDVFVADTYNHRIQRFTSTGGFIAKWGTNGAGNGQFSSPRGIALDSSGNIYVADTSNNRIQKFDNAGNWLATWGGSCSTADGYFCTPEGVTVDSSGNVYVIEAGGVNSMRIQKFNGSLAWPGNWLWKSGSYGTQLGQFSQPLGLTVDTSGNIYVADTNNGRIQKLATGFEQAALNMTTIDVDTVGDYRIWTTPSTTLAQYQADNQASLQITASNMPRIAYYDAVNSDLKYAFCDSGCGIQANWQKATIAATDDAGKFASLTLDPSGNPRVAYKQYYFNSASDLGYQVNYAYCDANCDNPANWTIVSNMSNGNSTWNNPIVSDSTGRLRLNYVKGLDASGILYNTYCNGSCGNKSNWINEEIDWNYIKSNSLALDSLGRRHTSFDQLSEVSSGLIYNLKNAP